MGLEHWPPDYQLRRSPRARNATLKISPKKGLEVVLPMRYSIARVADLLNEKRRWIEKNLAALQQTLSNEDPHALPKQLHLQAIEELWKIYYLPSQTKTKVIVRPQYELTLMGQLDDVAYCRRILGAWLRNKAKQVLPIYLQELSQELNLPYQNLVIRNQQSRWGSCSSKKNINLNFKLIFLPPDIMRHVLVHELCHTVHMNHSQRFWRLVARFDPSWQAHHQASRRMEGHVPLWLD